MKGSIPLIQKAELQQGFPTVLMNSVSILAGFAPRLGHLQQNQPYIRYLEISYIISDYFWDFFVNVKNYFKSGAKDTEIRITSHKVQQTFLSKTPPAFSKVGVNEAQWMEKENKKKAGRKNTKIRELS